MIEDYFVEGLAVVAGVRGEAERSARLFGVAEGLLQAVEASVYAYYGPNRSLYERTKADACMRQGNEVFDAAWTEGCRMTFDEAVVYALEGDEAPSSG